jgi:tripartite-type tricarboxylate transporter receptor subunit TctC
VKSIHEQGVPGFEATTWAAVIVPKGTPAEAIEVLNKGINQVMMLPLHSEAAAGPWN